MTDSVNAEPTKRLVVYVLTKDVRLDDAILDLIDNSIDGARRLSNSKLIGHVINVSLSKDSFEIHDNCGGIPYTLARDYAFRFGRPEDYVPLDSTNEVIGNFGVGMKRALFKMGRAIKVTSRTKECYFEININVAQWMHDPEWKFEFSNVRVENADSNQVGTSIVVTDLYPGVAEQFGLRQFIANLESSIEAKQAVPMLEGIAIGVNKKMLHGIHMTLKQSKEIVPCFHKEILTNSKNQQAKLEIFAGVDDSNNDRAGWYIVCNGRTVLRADRTNLTGWGSKTDSDRIPSYHNQYARFRGFVMFHSDTPDCLPWNTAKSGVDIEHPFYRRALQLMLQAMNEVFAFLNEVDKETDTVEQPYNEALAKMRTVSLDKISESRSFSVSVVPVPLAQKNKLKTIRYKKPEEEVNAVMGALGVDNPSDAGEQLFDTYYQLNVRA